MPFWSRGLLKISIIGTGRHSLNIRKICNSIKNLKIDFLFSRKKKYIKGYKVTKYFKDLLNYEIIFICVQTSMNLNVLKKLNNLKFKNYIICEKPLVNTLSGFKYIKKLPNFYKKRLFVNYNFVNSKLAKIISKKVKNKLNGKLKYTDFQISHGAAWLKSWRNDWRIKSRLGPIETTGIHYIHFLKKIFGNYKIITRNFSNSARNKGIDTVEFALKFSRTFSFFRFSYSEPHQINFKLIFSNAIILYNGKMLNYYYKRDTFNQKGRFIEPKLKENYKINFYKDWNYSIKKNIKKMCKIIKNKKFNNTKQLYDDLNVLKPFY